VVIQRRIGIPVMFWARWRKKSAFDALVSYTRKEREVKDMQGRVDAYREGMLKRIGVKGIVFAADGLWEEKVRRVVGMDEKIARLGLKFGKRWMRLVFNGRDLNCMFIWVNR
jgi:hypothetical protein